MSSLKFVVRKSQREGVYFKLDGGKVAWVQKELASDYPSKYAAKSHIAKFSEVPVTRVIEPFS